MRLCTRWELSSISSIHSLSPSWYRRTFYPEDSWVLDPQCVPMHVPRVAIHTKPCDLIFLDVWNGATSYIPMVEERPLTVEPDIYQQSESLLARILVRTHRHPTTWLCGTARCRAEYNFTEFDCHLHTVLLHDCKFGMRHTSTFKIVDSFDFDL